MTKDHPSKKRVTFAQRDKHPPKRGPPEESKTLPWLHCVEDKCIESERFKKGETHRKNCHGGKRATIVFCKPVNCKFCIYRKFTTTISIIISITITITTNTTL